MKLSKIFNVEICKNPISMEFAYENPGEIPYVTTTSFNNGVETFVDYPAQYEGGKITVSKDGGSADAFLQEYPFCGNEKVMVLSPKVEMTKKELLFYCYLINKNKYKFAYGRKCSVERINELDLIEIKDFPNWVNNVNIKRITTDNKLLKKDLKINNWKEFNINSLFSIERGNITSLNNIEEGEIPIVSASGENEGIAFYSNIPPKYSDKITVSMNGVNTGFTSYHGYPFNINVDACVLKEKFPMNKYIGLFIATIINTLRYKYSYGRKMSAERLQQELIKLPVDKNGEPDREFMENYIKSLPYGDRI